MVDIPEADWQLLPDVPAGQDSVNIDAGTEKALQDAGYIIGELQRVIFYEPGVKETNWSATRPVVDTKGKTRRWVYLHYFKAGQPSINWLDPTFSGMRLVIGDAHPFAGRSRFRRASAGRQRFPRGGEERGGSPAWSEGHPLSEAANQLIGSMVRKVGGFTFQELNLTIDDIKATGEVGPDLSYDFVTRPGYHHALVTGGHRVPPPHAARGHADRHRPGVAGARHAEPRRIDLRTGAFRDETQGRRVHPGGGAAVGAGSCRDRPANPAGQDHRPGGAVQPDLHHQRNRLHHSNCHHRGAGDRRSRGGHRRRDHADPPGAPAARDVQRAAARCFRIVRLGPVRHGDDRQEPGAEPDRGRRHPVDRTAARTT